MRLVILRFVAFLVLVTLPSVSALYQAPVWSNRENLFVGSLTWNGGGGISWNEKPQTQDPGGPSPDPSQAAKSAGGWYLRTSTAGANGKEQLRVDTFTSEPLPRLLYLNASRPIEIDLFLKSTDCEQRNTYVNQVDLELWLGDVFVGGALHGYEVPAYHRGGLTWQGGYCILLFNLHPEVDRLAAGSVLTLKVIQYGQGTGYQYGMGDGHRSVVRIPYYSELEVAKRIPEIVAASAGKPGDEAGVSSLALLSLAAFPFMVRRRSLALVSILVLAFAGCVGGGGDGANDAATNMDPSDGEVDVDVVPLENGTVKVGTGALLGTVTDDYGYAIRGAHVTLLGTNNFTETDANGAFQLLDIPEGQYRLRIDKKEFVSLEVPVRVEEGKATRLEVIMVLLVDKAAGQRPHSHDYWEGQDEKPLLSADVRFTGSAGDSRACVAPYASQNLVYQAAFGIALNAQYNYMQQGACYASFYPPEKSLVAPGTYDIEAKVSWDANANKVERVGIGFTDNRPWNSPYNYTLLYPRKSGETYHIRTGWEMTDLGHQEFSLWKFFLYIPYGDGSTTSLLPTAQTLSAPFHVEMKIKRGVLAREPAHPDRYGPNITFNTMRDWYFYTGCYTVYGGTPCTNYAYSYYYPITYPYPVVLVPQETKWIQAWLNRTPTNSIPPQPEVVPDHFDLLYKPANVSPATAAKTDYKWPKAKYVGKTGDSYRYIIPVKPEEADPFYAKTTLWTWKLGAPDGLYNGSPTFRFTMVSHRDAEPSSF